MRIVLAVVFLVFLAGCASETVSGDRFPEIDRWWR